MNKSKIRQNFLIPKNFLGLSYYRNNTVLATGNTTADALKSHQFSTIVTLESPTVEAVMSSLDPNKT